MAGARTDRRAERELAYSDDGRARVVAGMDEVGRGCLAGPVSVGVVVSDLTRRAPSGLRDSKLLTPARRESLVPAIRRWAVGYAVGHASPGEIDEVGIIAALRLAGQRALAAVREAGVAVDVVLLDGSHDWLTTPVDLFSGFDDDGGASSGEEVAVVTRVKADLTCTGVAAASILAKVERDGLMREAHAADPRYDWAENKGYSAPAHLEALGRFGPCAFHRNSWHLPGVEDASGGVGKA